MSKNKKKKSLPIPDMERFYYEKEKDSKVPRVCVCIAKFNGHFTKGISIFLNSSSLARGAMLDSNYVFTSPISHHFREGKRLIIDRDI